MISSSEIKAIIAEHDAKEGRRKLDYYISFMKIVLRNEGIDLVGWDELYTDGDRKAAFDKANRLISLVLQPVTPESPGFGDHV